MTSIDDFVVGHQLVRRPLEVDVAFAEVDKLVECLGHVGPGDYCENTVHRLGCRGVDRLNVGVGVRASHANTPYQTRQCQVPAVNRPSCHLVVSVMPDGARADDFIVGLWLECCDHFLSPRRGPGPGQNRCEGSRVSAGYTRRSVVSCLLFGRLE